MQKPTKPYAFTNGSGNTADANQINQNFDVVYSKAGEIIDEINAAAGALPSLSERLSASINEDGTLKGNVQAGSEWVSFDAANLAKVTDSTFRMDGDKTSIYTAGRRVKAKLSDDSLVYGKVSSSSFVTGTHTEVTLTSSVLTLPVSYVWHSILQPIASSGAVDAGMVGAEPQFASGTKMVFVQAAAPTGWTIDTTAAYNTAGLRIVTSAGGGTGGTSDAFSAHSHTIPEHGHGHSFSVAAHTLTIDQIPAHSHGGVPLNAADVDRGSALASAFSLDDLGQSGTTGGGGSHTHGLSGGVSNQVAFTSGNFTPKYVNCIVCVKS